MLAARASAGVTDSAGFHGSRSSADRCTAAGLASDRRCGTRSDILDKADWDRPLLGVIAEPWAFTDAPTGPVSSGAAVTMTEGDEEHDTDMT